MFDSSVCIPRPKQKKMNTFGNKSDPEHAQSQSMMGRQIISTLPSNPTSPSNASFVYRITVGNKVSDDTLKACAELFSSNYGIWGDEASKVSSFTKAGQ
jgi:hypothetical protein